MKLLRSIWYAVTLLTPWWVRHRLLNLIPGWQIAASARIGWSWVDANRVTMESGTRIGHGNVIRGLEELRLDRHSVISSMNWVAGYPLGGTSFRKFESRWPALHVATHAAITCKHTIDCTDSVIVEEFSTVAGYGSQILTHSINLARSEQECAPVTIGRRTFVGTRSVILMGASLPDDSVLAAGSVLLRNSSSQTHTIYAGAPAVAVKQLDSLTKYFLRERGEVT